MYGTASDVRVVGTPNIVIVYSKLSDDLVYKITKAFFEPKNLEIIRTSHPSAKALTLETGGSGGCPFTSGRREVLPGEGDFEVENLNGKE